MWIFFIFQPSKIRVSPTGIISSIPIYSLYSVKMHVTNLNSIDRARKHGLWRGSDVAGKGKPLLAWEKVTAPRDKGGLGLKNLRIMNETLLIKHA
jgi:hypothetical protein